MVRFDYGVILIESLKKAAQTADGFLDAKAVARAHKLSPSLMEKVAQELKRAGLLESRRGSGGGYKLAVEPSAASMDRLFNAFRWPTGACPMTNKI